jgi:uncharacterized membrane protein
MNPAGWSVHPVTWLVAGVLLGFVIDVVRVLLALARRRRNSEANRELRGEPDTPTLPPMLVKKNVCNV